MSDRPSLGVGRTLLRTIQRAPPRTTTTLALCSALRDEGSAVETASVSVGRRRENSAGRSLEMKLVLFASSSGGLFEYTDREGAGIFLGLADALVSVTGYLEGKCKLGVELSFLRGLHEPLELSSHEV